jgi:hypothetical protein
MKKVFLVLALVATVLVSCNKVTTTTTETSTADSTADSTEVVVDSVQVDSTVVDTVSAK